MKGMFKGSFGQGGLYSRLRWSRYFLSAIDRALLNRAKAGIVYGPVSLRYKWNIRDGKSVLGEVEISL